MRLSREEAINYILLLCFFFQSPVGPQAKSLRIHFVISRDVLLLVFPFVSTRGRHRDSVTTSHREVNRILHACDLYGRQCRPLFWLGRVPAPLELSLSVTGHQLVAVTVGAQRNQPSELLAAPQETALSEALYCSVTYCALEVTIVTMCSSKLCHCVQPPAFSLCRCLSFCLSLTQ